MMKNINITYGEQPNKKKPPNLLHSMQSFREFCDGLDFEDKERRVVTEPEDYLVLIQDAEGTQLVLMTLYYDHLVLYTDINGRPFVIHLWDYFSLGPKEYSKLYGVCPLNIAYVGNATGGGKDEG